MTVYDAHPIKRRRATQSEMEERAEFLINYANEHGPVTSRGLYYQAEVAGIPGIDKTDRGYAKVQRQVLQLRRAGRLDYEKITDATRYMRRPRTFDGWENALQETARLYRKSLWSDSDEEVEVWVEKSALAGVIYSVTDEYDVPLMPSGGYTSETFAHEAVARLAGVGRRLVVYSLYDFDRSGQDAASSLREKVERFGDEYGVPVSFNILGLTYDQVVDLDLPIREPKRTTTADKRWPYDCAAELDAIPPDTLRTMVREAIERHLPAYELQYLKEIEKAERATLMDFIGRAA